MSDPMEEIAMEKLTEFLHTRDIPRPCPFCGCKVIIGTLEHGAGYAILHPRSECIWAHTDNEYSDNVYETKEECAAAWNQRI